MTIHQYYNQDSFFLSPAEFLQGKPMPEQDLFLACTENSPLPSTVKGHVTHLTLFPLRRQGLLMEFIFPSPLQSLGAQGQKEKWSLHSPYTASVWLKTRLIGVGGLYGVYLSCLLIRIFSLPLCIGSTIFLCFHSACSVLPFSPFFPLNNTGVRHALFFTAPLSKLNV